MLARPARCRCHCESPRSQSIGPSLGQDSIDKGIARRRHRGRARRRHHARYYRFSGLLAVRRLVLYVLYTLAALAGFDAVLTLPGIAGFVLSIGIAVDANVLIFERIREELDRGKTVRTAIDEGFRHAMPRDRRLERVDDPHGGRALSVRHGSGARLRGHAHRRYRRVAGHLDLRRADLLPPVAATARAAPRR